MSNIYLIYIHLGNKFIEYLNDSIYQTFLFNNDINIIVVVNKQNKSKIKDKRVQLISYEKITQTAEHKYFINNHTMKSSRNKFWIYTIERFFILYEVMKKLDIKKVFHMESDNLLYRDLKELYPMQREFIIFIIYVKYLFIFKIGDFSKKRRI